MVLLVGATFWAGLVKHLQKLCCEHLVGQILEAGDRKQQQIFCGLATDWELRSRKFAFCFFSRKLGIF